MRPAHLPIFPYLCSITGLCSDRKASSNRWMNAVASMTPVPKCFPIKKRIGGMCKKGISIDMAGNDTAGRRILGYINVAFERGQFNKTHRRVT